MDVRENRDRTEALRSSSRAGGASGRFWIPRTVANFDHESCIASSSSFANFVDMFTRATTTPGMSPSWTSWSIRAKVSVNSYSENEMFAKFAYDPARCFSSIWMLS